MTQEDPTPDAQPPEPVTTDSLLTSHATVNRLDRSNRSGRIAITITSAGLISPNASVPNGNGIYLDGVTYTVS